MDSFNEQIADSEDLEGQFDDQASGYQQSLDEEIIEHDAFEAQILQDKATQDRLELQDPVQELCDEIGKSGILFGFPATRVHDTALRKMVLYAASLDE